MVCGGARRAVHGGMNCVRVVIVGYNSRAHLARCIEALGPATDDLDLDIVFVDNASTDGSAAFVSATFPHVRVIANDVNRGFAGANNQAIESGGEADVLLLNPDAFLLPGSLDTLVASLRENTTTAVVGPRLLNPDGSLQHSIGFFPSLLNQLGSNLFLARLLPRARWFSEIDRRWDSYSVGRSVDWLFGAVLLVRRRAIDQVGLFDERFFVFSEEKDWCMRFRSAGWATRYVPEAEAIHVGREGHGGPRSYELLVCSKLELVRKYHGSLAASVVGVLTVFRHAVLFVVAAIRGEAAGYDTRVCRAGMSAALRASVGAGVRPHDRAAEME